MLENGVAQQPMSLVNEAAEAVNPKGWLQTIKDNKDVLVEIGIYAGLGFLCGFLFRRFGTYFIAFLVAIGVLLLMQQVDLVTFSVNWDKVQSFFGIQPLATPDTSWVGHLWEWVKINIRPVVSFSVGFFIGFNVA